MHISLDSALGRQRRLNSVGESVFQIAPDASAGYSLRSLTGGDPSVVRVRRDSDNGERDFRSSEINSGEMVSWVNQQAIKPLDIRELEADGRTGDFLIPKAAYSLRSLGERQATLAATGDTVARADGKFVIQARRSSDDALKSFTAAEVADGTLTAWVTEYVANLVGNARYFNGTSTSVEVDRPATDSFAISGSFLSVNTGGYGILSFGDNINNRFYLGAASSGRIQIFNINAGSLVFDQTVLTDYADGTIHNFSFVTGVSGTILTIDGSEIINISTQINTSNYATSKMRFGSRFTTAYASYIEGTLYDITIDSTNAYTGLGTAVTAWEDTIGSNNGIEVNGATYTGQGFDGMVSKWYDQSVTNQAGNVPSGNHAVQATAAEQPKIVSAGALVANGLDFDGSDNKLNMPTDLIASINSASAFLVAKSDTTSGTRFPLALSRNSPDFRFYVGGLLSSKFYFGYQDSSTKIELGSADTNKHLFTSIAGSSNADGFLDGTSKGTVSSADGKSALSSGGIGAINIGNFWDGTIQEIVVYNSDQTDNRTALEANIGEAYSIAGIPAYANTVNGFVETWYDQSGNGNDAVQATASSQPKIVDGGTYLGDVHFDGSNDYLSNSDIGAYQSSDGVGFFCAYSKDVASTSDTFDSENPQYLLQLRDSYLEDSTFTARILGGKLDVARANEAGNSFFRTTSNTHTIGTDLVLSSVTGTQAVALFEDGLELSLQTDESGLTYDSVTTGLIIGSQDTGTRFLDGGIKELIIYKSDQSANRPAIEANINSHYDIY